ncbi:MAG: hypothetical protein IPK13_19105 [Deltaproteobacteria bacterium]|nr:hypothetical protein [Deltaproteobacteria bacterium]
MTSQASVIVRSFRFSLFAIALTAFVAAPLATAKAGDHAAKNLKVLLDNGETLEKGMKTLSKGLGVKCNACHVKGDFASEKVPAKEHGRTFLKAVLETTDKPKREAALTELLKAMKLKQAKKPALVWSAFDSLKKK